MFKATLMFLVVVMMGCKQEASVVMNDSTTTNLSATLKKIELKLKDAGLYTNQYTTEYREPHLKKLKKYNSFIIKEKERLKKANQASLSVLDRQILDATVNKNSHEVNKLKKEKAEIVKAYKLMLREIKKNSDKRVAALNKEYVTTVSKDFDVAI